MCFEYVMLKWGPDQSHLGVVLQDEPAYSGPSGDTPGEDSGTTACVLLLFKVSLHFLLCASLTKI